MSTPVASISSVLKTPPPPAQVLLAIVSVQIGAALAIDLFPLLGPAGTVLCRLAISAFFLTILIKPKFELDIWKHHKLILGYGVTLAVMNWCFYASIARIPLGIAVTIEFMGPLLVGVFASRRLLDLVWIAIAVTGLLILMPELGGKIDQTGVVYAVFAGIGWGGFVLLSKRINVALDGNSGLVYGMIVASLFMVPISITSITPIFSDLWLLGNIVLLAILSTTIPFFLEFSALKKLSAQTYGVLITMEPAAAASIGAIMLGDILGVEGMIAIACVTIAAFGATLTQKL